jgi:hypothetical protein
VLEPASRLRKAAGRRRRRGEEVDESMYASMTLSHERQIRFCRK